MIELVACRSDCLLFGNEIGNPLSLGGCTSVVDPLVLDLVPVDHSSYLLVEDYVGIAHLYKKYL